MGSDIWCWPRTRGVSSRLEGRRRNCCEIHVSRTLISSHLNRDVLDVNPRLVPRSAKSSGYVICSISLIPSFHHHAHGSKVAQNTI